MALPKQKFATGFEESFPTPPSPVQQARLKQTLGAGRWDDRLHSVSRARLVEIKTTLEKFSRQLEPLLGAPQLSNELRSSVEDLRNYTHAVQETIFPDLVALLILAEDRIRVLEGRLANERRGVFGRLATRIKRGLGFLDAQTERKQELLLVDKPVKSAGHAKVDNAGTSFELFSDWVSIFHRNGKLFGAPDARVSDFQDDFSVADEQINFSGKRILELGSLEGANTKQLVDFGAKEVIAIEANRKAFLKSLIIKNEFSLNNVRFIYGDCNEILSSPDFFASEWFDVCVASGILYHMEDPLLFLDLVCSSAPRLFIWTQVATEDSPSGEWVTLKDAEFREYRGRRNVYKSKKHLGGVAGCAHWLVEEDLYKALEDRGFEVEQTSAGRTPAGRCITLIAHRRDIPQHAR